MIPTAVLLNRLIVQEWGAMMNKIKVIGVGECGASSLTDELIHTIHKADLLVGGERLLSFFPEAKGERVVLKGGLAAVVERLAELAEGQSAVVLASGDPLFFGIAGYLSSRLGRERLDILPHLSSVQLVFAKLGESWQDAQLESLHGRPIQGLAQRLDGRAKIALLTDDVNTPSALAAYLLHFEMNEYEAFVGEDLGGPDEQFTHWSLADMAEAEFGPLNVVVLRRLKDTPPARVGFGFADEEFHQRKPEKGLITKREVRVFSLSELRLSERSVVWDIGAGSGSVAVECARLAKYGQVFAIEKNEGDLQNVEANKIKFRTDFPVIHAKAPEGLSELPDPNAVFIGGSGGELKELIHLCGERLQSGGRVVVNAVTIETLHDAMKSMQEAGLAPEVTLLQTARSKPILNMTRFEGLNPIYVITGTKS